MDKLLLKYAHLILFSACLVLAGFEIPRFLDAANDLLPLLFSMCYLAAGFAYVSSKNISHWPLSIALAIKFSDIALQVAPSHDMEISLYGAGLIALLHACSFIPRAILPSFMALFTVVVALLAFHQFAGLLEALLLVFIGILASLVRVFYEYHRIDEGRFKKLKGIDQWAQQQLKLMAAATNVQLIDMNFEQDRVDMSPGIRLFAGEQASEPETCLQWWRSILSSDYSRQFETAMQTAHINNEPLSLPLAINLTGQLQYYRLTVLATRNKASNGYQRIILILQDQQAEVEAGQQNLRSEAILKAVREVCELRFMWGLIDREKGGWTTLHGPCKEIFEASLDDWVGQTALVGDGWENMSDSEASKLRFALVTGQPLMFERRYFTPDSKQLRNIACCLWQNIDDPDVMECVLIENSSLSLRDKRIKQLSDSLNIAETATTDFLTSVNHELMTPMNSLASYIQVAFASCEDRAVRGHLTSAMNSVRRLKTMLNDTVSMGEIHLVHMRPDNKPFSLGEMIYSLKESVETRLEGRQVVFSLLIDKRLPDSVQGDQTRIKQVLLRVLTYASTFSRRGKVTLSIKQQSVDFKRGLINVLFVIKDSSRGIASESLNRISRDERQDLKAMDDGFKHDQAMTLLLSRRHTQYLKGDFNVESISGLGNTFNISFPLEAVRSLNVKSAQDVFDAIRTDSPDAPSFSEQQDRLHGMQILIVDDNPLNNESLKLLLELEGAVVTDMLSPLKALNILEQENIPFKGIILDVQMSEMNGFELAEAIRALPNWHDTPIVFISANYDRSLADKCRVAGGNLLLSKPFNREQLIEPLRGLIDGEDVPLVSQVEMVPDVLSGMEKITLDVDLALENLGGNTTIFENMLNRFLARIDGDAEEFRQLMLADDPKAASAQAHFIAGGAAIIGATSLSQWLKDFEQRVLVEQKLVEIDSDLEKFDSMCRETINAVQLFLESN